MSEFFDQTCHNHPERAAIEYCEVCNKGLCGYCLYYTDDGQRLCETHAQQAKLSGTKIIPPAVYADGIIASQASAKERSDVDFKIKGVVDSPVIMYKGNNQDLTAFVAMLAGLLSAGICFGAIYCLPFFAALLGIIGLINAKDAVDPRRTRTQSWIALLTGGLISLACIGCIVAYASIYGLALTSFNTNVNTYPSFPSPTYTFAPTGTPAPTETPNPAIEPIQRTATALARPSATPAP